jgi:hypothetical protein
MRQIGRRHTAPKMKLLHFAQGPTGDTFGVSLLHPQAGGLDLISIPTETGAPHLDSEQDVEHRFLFRFRP